MPHEREIGQNQIIALLLGLTHSFYNGHFQFDSQNSQLVVGQSCIDIYSYYSRVNNKLLMRVLKV